MNEIISQGLKIATRSRYLKFTLGNSIQIKEDFDRSVFEVVFPDDTESSNVVDDRVKVLYKKKLVQTDYIRIEIPIINLNGLKLEKLIQKDYVFSQFIVNDIEDFIINCEEDRCLILIPNKLKDDIKNYISILSYNQFFKIIDYADLKSLNNYYNINLSKKSLTINSTNNFAFNTKEEYSKYIIETFDIIDSFIIQLREILNNYGLELISYPKDKKINTNNYVTYRIIELGTQQSRKTNDEEDLRYAIQHKSVIEFDASFTSIEIFTDFKNKYQNLDLITNFTTFYTKDKLGEDWLSAVRWNQVNTDFEQDYSLDNQGNCALKFMFSAELYYFVVYDELLYRINETILELLPSDMNNQLSKPESLIKN